MAKQILIVENSAEYRQLLGEIVTGLGLVPLVAEKARRALELLKSNVVSLILLDIKMPQIHGDAFLEHIRQRGNRVPVVVISGFLTPDVLQKVRALGVRHVVVKPFRIQRLAQVMAEILQGA
jgi:CheY-like chemotaxis protein